MADLVKIKGLKGKQNKKKWAKNIDVSGLLQKQAQQHDKQIRERFRPSLEVTDDNIKQRPPLDPNRFKNIVHPPPKKTYDNRIVRNLNINEVDDVWATKDEGRHLYKSTQIPAVIAPESGHSYNPRSEDINRLLDRVIDYEKPAIIVHKQKPKTELPQVSVRHRNKKKRAAQLQAKARLQNREFRQQLHNIKKLKRQIEEKEKQIDDKNKTKLIRKQKLDKQSRTGRVRLGKRLGKKIYRFKEYIPTGQKVDKVSQVGLSQELVRERFDSIFRRGVLEARNIKVHANKHKHIKVKEYTNK